MNALATGLASLLLGLVCTASSPIPSDGAAPAVAAERCARLVDGGVEGGAIDRAAFLPSGLHGRDPAGGELPAHCRVALTLRPSADSAIKVEVWLPAEGWNGRFLGIGIGGYAGGILEQELGTAVQRGYAAATTDTGHGHEGPEIWALNHPERVIDYGHRAIHLTAVAGKAITARHYGRAAHHAYFSGCSNGGRQGLMEALRYPHDYDGIIVGAPAADMVGLFVASFGWNAHILGRTPIPAFKLSAVGREVRRQCDGLDGVMDGVIGSPNHCRFDAAALRCASGDGDDCLTNAELNALRQVHAGPVRADGVALFPGFSVGGEDDGMAADGPSTGWRGWIVPDGSTPSAQSMYFNSFMSAFVKRRRDWSPADFQLERDHAQAMRDIAPVLNADAPDLRAFAARGGKLILYHGWSDQAIPPLATVQYYERLEAMLGRHATAAFSRLYMVPGMQHCFLGRGAWSFNPAAAIPGSQRTHDMARALEAWVEHDVAPTTLIASYPTDAKSVLAGTPPQAAGRTALLCPYPQTARLQRRGSRAASRHECTNEP